LNNLTGFSVTNASLVIPADPDGTNFVANLTYPNPSPLAFALVRLSLSEVLQKRTNTSQGNLTLNIIIANINMGTGTIENYIVSPGNNNYNMRCILDLSLLVKNIMPILTAEASSIETGGNITFVATVNSTVYNGQKIAWYETALKSLVLPGEIKLVPLVISTIQTFLNSPNGTNITNTIKNGKL
jgi:hypothetical protein